MFVFKAKFSKTLKTFLNVNRKLKIPYFQQTKEKYLKNTND